MTHSSHSKETRLITFSLQLPCIINSNLLFIMIIYNYTHTHAFRQERVIVAHELYMPRSRNLGPVWYSLSSLGPSPGLKASLAQPLPSHPFFFVFSLLLADSSSSTVVSGHHHFLQTSPSPP